MSRRAASARLAWARRKQAAERERDEVEAVAPSFLALGLGSAGVARVRAQSREDALRRALRGRAGLRAVSCEPATLGLFVGR